ncbi:MAG: hypothetical protein V4543_00785 [Bacteroidota bacterium]
MFKIRVKIAGELKTESFTDYGPACERYAELLKLMTTQDKTLPEGFRSAGKVIVYRDNQEEPDSVEILFPIPDYNEKLPVKPV